MFNVKYWGYLISKLCRLELGSKFVWHFRVLVSFFVKFVLTAFFNRCGSDRSLKFLFISKYLAIMLLSFLFTASLLSVLARQYRTYLVRVTACADRGGGGEKRIHQTGIPRHEFQGEFLWSSVAIFFVIWYSTCIAQLFDCWLSIQRCGGATSQMKVSWWTGVGPNFCSSHLRS